MKKPYRLYWKLDCVERHEGHRFFRSLWKTKGNIPTSTLSDGAITIEETFLNWKTYFIVLRSQLWLVYYINKVNLYEGVSRTEKGGSIGEILETK